MQNRNSSKIQLAIFIMMVFFISKQNVTYIEYNKIKDNPDWNMEFFLFKSVIPVENFFVWVHLVQHYQYYSFIRYNVLRTNSYPFLCDLNTDHSQVNQSTLSSFPICVQVMYINVSLFRKNSEERLLSRCFT